MKNTLIWKHWAHAVTGQTSEEILMQRLSSQKQLLIRSAALTAITGGIAQMDPNRASLNHNYAGLVPWVKWWTRKRTDVLTSKMILRLYINFNSLGIYFLLLSSFEAQAYSLLWSDSSLFLEGFYLSTVNFESRQPSTCFEWTVEIRFSRESACR